MAIVEITKARVIKAIRTEPALYPSRWVGFHPDTESELYEQGIDTCEFFDKSKIKEPNCSVCAVGAVMRSILNPDQNISKIEAASHAATGNRLDAFGGEGSIPEIKVRAKRILNGEYGYDPSPMTALSYIFESLSSYYLYGPNGGHVLTGRQVSVIRRSVVTFVEKNFPNKIQIDIDGAKPAKDVKVIKKASSAK